MTEYNVPYPNSPLEDGVRIQPKKKPKHKEIKETISKVVDPPYQWPSRIEGWCCICTEMKVAARKKENGEFEEQAFCQHFNLKKVVK